MSTKKKTGFCIFPFLATKQAIGACFYFTKTKQFVKSLLINRLMESEVNIFFSNTNYFEKSKTKRGRPRKEGALPQEGNTPTKLHKKKVMLIIITIKVLRK
jgi:hypothetical protein